MKIHPDRVAWAVKFFKLARFFVGVPLLITLFACGGGQNLFDQCIPWSLNAQDAVTVTQGESAPLTVAPTVITTAELERGYWGGLVSDIPAGMKLEFVAQTIYISTEATTPKGVYQLKIGGVYTAGGFGDACNMSNEEAITVTVD